MGIELRGKNGAIDLKVPIKQLGGAVDSVNGQTGDVTLTANDVDAIDKYNGMTPVECVYTHFGSQQTKIIYVEEGTLIPPSSSASDDIKNAWKRLLAIPLSGLAPTSPSSSFKDLIRGIGLLADNGVFGDLLSQSGNEFICYTDIFKQEVCLHIYNSKTDDKTITVYFNFYKQDKYQQAIYCISNDTFDDYCYFEAPVKQYLNNINVTALTMPQTEMAAAPTKDMQIATKKYVDDSASNPLNITGATVGQIAKITAVDDSGKPTAWEAVDMSSGSGDVGVGKQRLIADITLTEPVKSILIDMDMDGNQLSLTDVDMFAYVATNAETSYDYASVVVNGFNAFSSSNFGISTTKKTVSCFFRLREDGTASAVRSQQNQWNNYNGVDVLSSLAGGADANTGKNYGDTIRSVGIKHVGGATEALLATGTRFIVWGR